MQTKVWSLGIMLLVTTVSASHARNLGKDRRTTDLPWFVRKGKPRCCLEQVVLRTGFVLFLPMTLQTNSDCATQDNTEPSALKRMGIYSVEFSLAAVGTAISAVGAICGTDAVADTYGDEDIGMFPAILTGLSTYILTCPFLSAGGTYLGGKLLGQKGAFWHTFVGGLIGGVFGGVAAAGFSHYAGQSGHWGSVQTAAVIGCAIIPPALGAVISYNAWR